MTSRHADIEHLKRAIDALLAQCPEMREDGVLREDMLVGSTDIEDVIGRLISALQDALVIQEALKLRIANVTARKTRYERQEEALRNLIQSTMERGNLSKLVLPEATLSVSLRKPAPIVVDETALPDECIKLVRKPDMAVIKAQTEAGNMPAGVSMSNGTSVLTVRTR